MQLKKLQGQVMQEEGLPADEVKALAFESKQSAEKIGSMIATLQR